MDAKLAFVEVVKPLINFSHLSKSVFEQAFLLVSNRLFVDSFVGFRHLLNKQLLVGHLCAIVLQPGNILILKALKCIKAGFIDVHSFVSFFVIFFHLIDEGAHS